MKESYLGHEIEVAGDLDAQYDECAKRLVKDTGVLAYILVYSVKEFKDYTLDEAKAAILGEPEVSTREIRAASKAVQCIANESSLPNEGKIYFDIVFNVITKEYVKEKLYVNIEIQKSFYPGYDLLPRAVTYGARLLSQQMDVEFEPDNYDGVKKVYSIWICLNTPFFRRYGAKVADTITEYSLSPKTLYSNDEAKSTVSGRYDLLSIIFICLKDDTMKSTNKLISMLSTLFSTKISVETKKTILEKDFNLPMTKEMEGAAAKMCSFTDLVAEKDAALAEKDAEIENLKKEKDEALAEKDEALAEKDAEIENLKKETDARIAELEAELAKSRN